MLKKPRPLARYSPAVPLRTDTTLSESNFPTSPGCRCQLISALPEHKLQVHPSTDSQDSLFTWPAISSLLQEAGTVCLACGRWCGLRERETPLYSSVHSLLLQLLGPAGKKERVSPWKDSYSPLALLSRPLIFALGVSSGHPDIQFLPLFPWTLNSLAHSLHLARSCPPHPHSWSTHLPNFIPSSAFLHPGSPCPRTVPFCYLHNSLHQDSFI